MIGKLAGRFAAVSSTTVLGYALLGALLASIASFAGGTWVGMRWVKGATALARVVEQDNEIVGLREEHKVQLRELNQAAEKLSLISEGLEHDRNAIDRSLAKTRASLDAYLSSRPDLAGCDFGPDGLRIYIEALRPSTARAAAGDSGQSAATVPGVADPDEAGRAGAVAERDRSRAPIPHVRGPAAAPGGSGDDSRAGRSGTLRADLGTTSASTKEAVVAPGDASR
ncbi:hypothetical protein C7S18_12225 [Ahniella affigens]|uniref:Uncharacterized protein n=1 Tax=Ahniella affigens TaxID=2021234 RepID=A0A2P1PSU3_9GAMM|nr:hypothetical protein [Ahniella affigens]AVP97918.1 hypothetical protein C7S18_12225 [Ahniella affigens]